MSTQFEAASPYIQKDVIERTQPTAKSLREVQIALEYLSQNPNPQPPLQQVDQWTTGGGK